ncbi:MAG: sugar-binding protein [Planctomycetota bacterium]|nr:MAG: sugar-binding protein [Planctomycetota bacterium]
MLTGCGREKEPTVAFVTNGVASFWVLAQAGANQAAEDLDINVDVRMPDGLVDQNRIIEDLLVNDVLGIAISPIDGVNQNTKLNEAAARTHLITHDSDAPESNRELYIGMDNYTAGRLCGELVREAMPEGGQIVIFIGRLEQENAKRRRQGVIDELLGRDADPTRYDSPDARLEGNGFVILDTRTDDFTQVGSQTQAEDVLALYPEIDGMIGLFAYNPPAILNALRNAGKVGEVTVVGFDEDEATLEGIKAGEVYGTVVQNPYMYGYESVRVLAALAEGDTSVIPASGFLDIPARKILPDNVEAFHADLKEKLGQGG